MNIKDRDIAKALTVGVKLGEITMQDIFFMAACFYSDTIQHIMDKIKNDQRRARPKAQ